MPTFTVADALRTGQEIHVGCGRAGCGHKGIIDLAALPQAMDFDDMRARLRCSACGGRRVHLSISVPGRATGEYPAPPPTRNTS